MGAKNGGVDWSYFDRFEDICEYTWNGGYLPLEGQGDNVAQQLCTCINKIIYKWYNDGDVYDNVMNYSLSGWVNDLSSYANWMACNIEGAKDILMKIGDADGSAGYEKILKEIADKYLVKDVMEGYEKFPVKGSIYDCDGPFEFREVRDDEDEDDYEEDWE